MRQPPGAEVRAQHVYDDINGRTARHDDFAAEALQQSRQFFDLATPELRTRPFDVLTTLAGLPLAETLQRVLADELDAILHVLPARTRVYRVAPPLLHWESHIIRRPGEPEPPVPVVDIVHGFQEAVSACAPFTLTYRGFFVSPDGTLAFQGYGPTSELRARLVATLPYSSARQNQTGHISVARILDPVGPSAFAELLAFRRYRESHVYGELQVGAIKLISERRWYMEDYEELSCVSLGG